MSESGFVGGDIVDEAQAYRHYRENLDPEQSPQNIGLAYEDFQIVLADSETITMEDKNGRVPVLVPTDKLYWYNQSYLREMYGDAKTYIFVGGEFNNQSTEAMKSVLDSGSVVLLAEYEEQSRADEVSESLSDEAKSVEVKKLDAFLNQYIGLLEFEGTEPIFQKAPSYREIYLGAVQDGASEQAQEVKVSVEEEIDDVEVDRLWKIYRSPFEDISAGSPISAGYDEQGFRRAMKDSSVVKVVNRDKGVITTLALFETTLDDASWLNPEYYEKEQKEALETGNLLLFTGIVSDEEMRGSSYSADVIKMLLDVAEIRGQNQVITFECNEVSSNYLPMIVDSTINNSERARVSGLHQEISRVVFHALKQAE